MATGHKCPNCGNQNETTAAFCGYCGTPLAYKNSSHQPSRRWLLVLVGLMALLIMTAGVLVMFWALQDGITETPIAENTPEETTPPNDSTRTPNPTEPEATGDSSSTTLPGDMITATLTKRPTKTPTTTPSPTPTETPTPVPVDEPSANNGGDICVNAFADVNGNGQRDSSEGYMAGVTFTRTQNNQVVAQGVSTGTDSPLCFEDISADTYIVNQIIPQNLEMTTPASATIQVTVGSTMILEFGSRTKSDIDSDDGGSSAGPTSPNLFAESVGRIVYSMNRYVG